MESFNLNIIPGKDRPVCHASQYDIGRTIHVNLFEGFNVFTLDGTEVISISVRKPDGNVVTESVTNTSDSYVEFVTTEQMTACHGSNLCELKLEKGADVIGTMNFILEVEQDPLDGGVQSDTQIHNLQTQVADLVAIEVADQYDSTNVIFDAVPTAGHGVGYAVTSEGVKNEVDPIKADVSSLQSDVGTLQSDVGYIKGDISDAFDDTATYAVGDFVIYQNVLYKCTTAVTTPGAWDGTKWTATTVTDEIGRIDGDVSTLQEANIYDNTERVVGSFYGSDLYRKCFVIPNITIPRDSIVDINVADYITGTIRLLIISIIVHSGTDFIILPYSYANQANQKYEIGYAVNQNRITLSRGDSSNIVAQDVTVVAEYIKVV